MSDKFAFIAAEQATSDLAPSVSAMCAGLGVSRSGFYDWQARQTAGPSPREQRRADLDLLLRELDDLQRRCEEELAELT